MNTFRLPLLSRIEGLRHVFVGRGPEPRPDPSELVTRLGVGRGALAPLARLRQVHSNRCLLVDQASGGVVGEGDALATSTRGVALGVATADCLPIVAVDPGAGALAVVHAGWRGTLAGVLGRALDRMRGELNARPERILIGAGPAVGACCYRVGPELIQRFREEHPRHADRIIIEHGPGVTHLDLIEANRLQALDSGIDPARIESLGICTVCNPALTHSYRREGPSAGRMWALAMLVE